MWYDEFLELMTGSTISLDAINKAHDLKDENLPNKLYKFRLINDDSLSNFESDTVWFCSADKYNDPYECATTWSTEEVMRQHTKINFDNIFEKTDLKKHLSNVEIDAIRASDDPMMELTRRFVENDVSIAEEQKEKMFTVFSNASNKFVKPLIAQMNDFIQRGTKICSFSTRVDSVVMWGHYANSHTGFAMEYDVTTWPRGDKRRRILYPVIYKQELFDATKYFIQAIVNRNFNNLFGAMAAIHKSPDWAYEREWRFVLPMGESFPDQSYPMPTPSAIYLGSKITPENEKVLSEIAIKKGIAIYKMELSTSEFELVPYAIQTV